MAIFFKEGEVKTRPGVYQRYENIGQSALVSAQDGICVIPVRASWGPLGKVIKNHRSAELTKIYGNGTYGPGYTVPAAAEMFKGGASVVYTYRLGSGGKQATLEIVTGLTVQAKYVGTMPLSVAVQVNLGDSTKKQFQVYAGTSLVESFSFVADGENEIENLIKAAAGSKYVDLIKAAATEDEVETVAETEEPTEGEVVGGGDSMVEDEENTEGTDEPTEPATGSVVPVLAVASGALTGGEDPVVTNEDYSKAFAAFEGYYYNTIALDVDDDADMSLSLMLQEYKSEAYEMGKLGIAVVGEKTTVAFEKRLKHAIAFNDYKCVYLGGGWMVGSENKDGVMAICRTAGIIAATPSNRGITHTVITGATDLCESLTYYQYEEAINSGMLMVSMSPDGEIWFDAAINTFRSPIDATNDEGWKKIRRTKVRFEMFDRMDRQMAPKVGRVTADTDGVADIIQTGQRLLDAMANEGKIRAGAIFAEDPDNPFAGDSAWFIIQADDNDSLEKIYLRYQFRYTQDV